MNIFDTGIESFNGLFGGGRGISWLGDRPPSILIHGGAGAGKTVFCSSIAAHVFKAMRKSVVYFSLEQLANDQAHLIRDFECGDNIDPILDKDFETNPTAPDDSSVFLISQYPATINRAIAESKEGDDSATFLRYLNGRLESLKDKDLGLIVLDSLPDALREHASLPGSPAQFDVNRGIFAKLCSLGQQLKTPVPLLIALEAADGRDWREFVPDVVVELGFDSEARRRGSIERFIAIRKARNQYVLNGQHPFRISPRSGIEIYPNPAEKLHQLGRAMAGKKRNKDSPSEAVDFSTLPGMHEFLVRDIGRGGRIPDGKVLRGSSTILIGQDRTRKNGVSASFLAAGCVQGERRHLYLVAGQNVDVAEEMLRWYLLKVSKSLVDFDSQSITVRAIDQYGQTSSEIFSQVNKELDTLSPISRVVINDLSALPHHSELIPILKSLFHTRQITALFVQTVGHIGASQYLDDFDNTIVARHVLLPDGLSRAIIYRLHKYQGASPAAPLWELRVTPHELSLRDTLRQCEEDASGKLCIPPLEVILFSEDVASEKRYTKVVEAIFGIGQQRLSISSAPDILMLPRQDADLVLDSLRSLSSNFPLTKTQVLCLDDPWVDEMIYTEQLENLSFLFPEALTAPFDDKAIRLGKAYLEDSFEGLFAIPHHIDFGFYIIDKEFAEFLGPEPAGGYNWEYLAEKAELFATPKRRDKRIEGLGITNDVELPLFDFTSSAVDETFLCFILEILYPFLQFNERDLGLDEEIVAQAIHKILKCLEKMKASPCAFNSRNRYFRQDGDWGQFAFIQRHWYVSFQAMC